MAVGNIVCIVATDAMDQGSVQEGNDFRVESIDRGECVEGVSMSFVRAISRGAKTMPAIPAAETAKVREVSGEGDDKMSIPPAFVKEDGS